MGLDQEQSRFLCDVTGGFGYDAIGLGEMDLNYGLKFLQEMIDEYHLPFTNANVRDPDTEELILPPYLIVERAGLRIGICAVLDPAHKIVSMAARDVEYIIDDPVVALRELIPELRKQVQTVIVLSHMGDRPTEELLKVAEGIDIAVVGHSFQAIKSERVVGDTVLLASGYEGRFMGRADMFLDTDGVVQTFTVEITSMDQERADDQVMLERIVEFKEHLAEWKLALRGDHLPVRGSDDENFLTERVCSKCHADVWEAVKASSHQMAHASLRKKGQGYNPECLVCHVVGYEYRNGYDDVPPYNKLSNVQCEACHGYGSAHSRDGRMLELARASCVECHDEENSPHFEFATYWEKIKH